MEKCKNEAKSMIFAKEKFLEIVLGKKIGKKLKINLKIHISE